VPRDTLQDSEHDGRMPRGVACAPAYAPGRAAIFTPATRLACARSFAITNTASRKSELYTACEPYAIRQRRLMRERQRGAAARCCVTHVATAPARLASAPFIRRASATSRRLVVCDVCRCRCLPPPVCVMPRDYGAAYDHAQYACAHDGARRVRAARYATRMLRA